MKLSFEWIFYENAIMCLGKIDAIFVLNKENDAKIKIWKGTETKSYPESWMKIWNLLDKFSIQTFKVYGVSARTLVQKTTPDHLWLEFYLAVMSPHQSPNQNVRLRSGNRENYISKYSDWGACCYFSQSLLLWYMMLDVNFFVSQ